MADEFDDGFGNGGGDGGVEDEVEGSQAHHHFVDVGAVQILLDGGDQHDGEVGVLVEEQRTQQIPDPLQNQVFALSQVDRLDVGEGGRVPQHLDVQRPDQVLFELFGGDVLLVDSGLERAELVEDDAVFFLLGLGLSDALDELLQVLRHVGGSHLNLI